MCLPARFHGANQRRGYPGTRLGGICRCAHAAYTGVVHGLTCPEDLAYPCSGHGLCRATTGGNDYAPQGNRGYAYDRCGVHRNGVSCTEP